MVSDTNSIVSHTDPAITTRQADTGTLSPYDSAEKH